MSKFDKTSLDGVQELVMRRKFGDLYDWETLCATHFLREVLLPPKALDLRLVL